MNKGYEYYANLILTEELEAFKRIQKQKDYGAFEGLFKGVIQKKRLSPPAKLKETILGTYRHMFGYGILQPLLEDEQISDINGTRYDHIVYKKKGKLIQSNIVFESEAAFLNYCKLIVLRNGGKLNSNHSFDRVDDNENFLRITVSIPPRSSTGPSLSIRKHPRRSRSLEELSTLGMLDASSLSILRNLMVQGKNLLIAGRGAAGKTTLLRGMLREVAWDKRFLVCESENELYPEGKNFIVERISSSDYGNSVNLSHLMRDGLSMSLEGYCVGEIVGEEAWEFISAGLTDHLTLGTIHSSGILEVILRLKMLINHRVGNYSSEAIEEMILGSLDYVVYLKEYRLEEIAHVEDGGWVWDYRRGEDC
ncbi:MAG: hypothetical protein AVO33_03150 [delta proteobacterium ML8_F1]|nr:MAG: hypothetical protein AVO33_03150 [delta proteobacterium ML8_F1]